MVSKKNIEENVNEKNTNGRNIIFISFGYWLLLMLWQIVGKDSGQSLIDIFIKISLIFLLLIFIIILRLSKKINKSNALFLALFSLTQFVSLVLNISYLDFRGILFSTFPILIFFLYFVANANQTLSQKDLIKCFNFFIFVVLFLSIYNMVFYWNAFSKVFEIRQAYGTELSSILVSNHEFGMYLTLAIFSVLIISIIKKKISFIDVFIIIIFILNLLSTISRTSIFALFVGLMVFVFLYNKKTFSFFIFFIAILVIVFSQIKSVSDYFTVVILKSNDSAYRGELLIEGFYFFHSLRLENKIFGFGYNSTIYWVGQELGHIGFHNAYLSTLIFGGIIQFSFLLFFIGYIFKSILKIKADKLLFSIFTALIVTGMFIMATNTAIIFTSPIDSFLLTIFCFVIPKYVSNTTIH